MSMPEFYLGIHIGHDCNVTAMDLEGNILFAAGEERFNRKKMFAGFPAQSLSHVLETQERQVKHLATARMRMRKKISRELGFLVSSMVHGRAAPRFGVWLKNGAKKLMADFKDVGLTLSEDDALKMVYEDNKPRFESIKWYLEILGIDFETAIKRINSIPKLYVTE